MKTDIDTFVEVVRAHYAGKDVEVCVQGDWALLSNEGTISWSPEEWEYRIKPQPRTFQLWRPVYENKTIKEPWRVVEGKHEYINPHHERIVVQEVMEE